MNGKVQILNLKNIKIYIISVRHPAKVGYCFCDHIGANESRE